MCLFLPATRSSQIGKALFLGFYLHWMQWRGGIHEGSPVSKNIRERNQWPGAASAEVTAI